MKRLTEEGQKIVDEIVSEYKVKPETVRDLLLAIQAGNGSMAQFNISELGGNGQWMKGGMTMVGDMFNQNLKAKVDNLSSELARKLESGGLFEIEKDIVREGSQGNSHNWPAVFGQPSASGSQNNFRYAYFPTVKRLVLDKGDKRYIYDTKHHVISGVSQQQGSTNSFVFSSQHGPVDIGELSIVSEPEKQATPEPYYDVHSKVATQSSDNEEDAIYGKIERLKVLHEKELITDEEYKEKKKELLSRL